ncbi:MAG: hypothetical protein M0005_13405 [Actinomycetota bacterium]|nr:hypothetical protein [Actinomycetota bacterium]
MLKVPNWAVWLLLALGGWYLLGNERRERVLKGLMPLGRFLQAQMEQASAALTVLGDSIARVEPGDRLECRVAKVLAHEAHGTALTAT